MEEYSLTHVHEIDKIMLRKIKDVCDRYGIVYYLDSGALIGAAREKDLLAWDDDVDIAIQRKEYEKLLALPKEVWAPELELVPCEKLGQGREWLDFVPRLVYMQEEFPVKTFDKINTVDPQYANRINTDIFLMDNGFDEEWKQRFLEFRLKIIYGFAMGHRGTLDFTEYKGLAKAAVRILSFIGKRIPIKKIYQMQVKAATSGKSDSKMLYYSNYPAYLFGIRLKKAWFEKRILLPLGEERIDAPAEYDQVLRSQYGDYMTPPPKKEQQPIHF